MALLMSLAKPGAEAQQMRREAPPSWLLTPQTPNEERAGAGRQVVDSGTRNHPPALHPGLTSSPDEHILLPIAKLPDLTHSSFIDADAPRFQQTLIEALQASASEADCLNAVLAFLMATIRAAEAETREIWTHPETEGEYLRISRSKDVIDEAFAEFAVRCEPIIGSDAASALAQLLRKRSWLGQVGVEYLAFSADEEGLLVESWLGSEPRPERADVYTRFGWTTQEPAIEQLERRYGHLIDVSRTLGADAASRQKR